MTQFKINSYTKTVGVDDDGQPFNIVKLAVTPILNSYAYHLCSLNQVHVHATDIQYEVWFDSRLTEMKASFFADWEKKTGDALVGVPMKHFDDVLPLLVKDSVFSYTLKDHSGQGVLLITDLDKLLNDDLKAMGQEFLDKHSYKRAISWAIQTDSIEL